MVDVIAIGGNILLFSLVFGMSATVDIGCMKAQLQNVRALLAGCFCQFFVLPLLGFMVVKLLKLDFAVGLTVLVVTSSPGGSYSNWWCSLFNADLALSVTMTAISTILSIFMLPLNLLLYTRYSYHADVLRSLDWVSLFVSLSVVIVAIFLGLFCSYRIKSRKFNKLANQMGNAAGLLLIIFSATLTNTGDADTKIWSRDWSFYVAVIVPCLGGLLVASVLSTMLRLHRPERVTVAIECCYQNVGIATSLALTMFEGDDLNNALGVPFFYGVAEAVFVGIYCVAAWKLGWTKAPSSAPLWQVLFTSYEVLEQEEKDLDGIEVDISDSTKSDEVLSEKQDGNILTTYFDLAWLQRDPTKPGILCGV